MVGDVPDEVGGGQTCGIARRLGEVVPCPPGGCALLRAIGGSAPAPGGGRCAASRAPARGGIDPDLVATLLQALGCALDNVADGMCPVEAIADRAGYDPVVVRTLDEVRRELDRVGVAHSAALAVRSRASRHEAALDRWPVGP